MSSSNLISQKEYLKKYLSGDVKKKKKKKVSGASIKRSVIVDDDIDLKSMRPLDDDEVELYQMDEDAPQIAGIVDERPPEVKAQEYYSSKRWKVFGGEDGVNVVDSMNKFKQDNISASNESNCSGQNINIGSVERTDAPKKGNLDKEYSSKARLKKTLDKTSENDSYLDTKNAKDKNSISSHGKNRDSDESPPRVERKNSSHCKNDSDVSPPRKNYRNSSSDSDVSLPRRKKERSKGSDESPPRKDSRKKYSKNYSRHHKDDERNKYRSRSHSKSPIVNAKAKKHKSKSDSNHSPPRREKNSYKKDESDSDASPPRKKDKYTKYSKESHCRSHNQDKSDSDASPIRKTDKYLENRPRTQVKRRGSSDSDNSPPRKDRRNSAKHQLERKKFSRSRTPPEKNKIHYKTDRDQFSKSSKANSQKHFSVFDNLTRRKRQSSEESNSDLSPPRKNSQVNDRPLKKVLYKPNDDSSDEDSQSKSKKLKTTLDGKQAGLQDARQLKKELSDLKMKEDAVFSKMDASVSGVGAAVVKRDRKTGQIRDLEKEKQAQKEKEAKESVVNEKYYKWGKGIKQTEDAAARAAEVMKEMNKPLARYVDDKDLDEFLKAQDREGDPMLEFIKRKQSESTPLLEEKPIYKGSWNPNRFNIRPGYRWDGVVRSNGYEQEWFKTKNAKKARDEEAYKWSTSDM